MTIAIGCFRIATMVPISPSHSSIDDKVRGYVGEMRVLVAPHVFAKLRLLALALGDARRHRAQPDSTSACLLRFAQCEPVLLG